MNIFRIIKLYLLRYCYKNSKKIWNKYFFSISLKAINYHYKFTYFSILILFILSYLQVYTQQEENIEKLFENVSQESNSIPALDDVEYFSKNKLNVLTVKPEDLASLPGISLLNAYRIVDFYKQYPNSTTAELCDSMNLSPEAELILDACTFSRRIHYKSNGVTYRARNFNNLSPIRGFEENIYIGNSTDFYQRLLFKSKYTDAGFLTNKDAGETEITDFFSGFAQIHFDNYKFIAGDFLPNYGMGSLLWQSFGSRKGSEVISPVLQIGSGIQPYKSSLDNQFFRGGAVQGDIFVSDDSYINVSAFASKTLRHASVDSNTNEVTSIYNTGYFRTETEILKKNKVDETALGGNLEFIFSGLVIGSTLLYLDYSKIINSESATAFLGKSGILNSVYSYFKIRNFISGGELSMDANSNIAFKAGLQKEFKKLEFALYYRYFSSGFRSPYGYGFGEFSNPANEEGIYTALSWKYNRRFNMNLYMDIYHSISRTYQVPAQVNGIDIFIESNFKFNNRNNLLVRLRSENRTDKITDLANKGRIIQKGRNSMRTDLATSYSKQFQTRFRLEYCLIDYEDILPNEAGIAAFSEFEYVHTDYLKIGARATLFQTDSYNSSVWQFEYAMPGFMSTTALYGAGSRFYIYSNIHIMNEISLIARYSITSKNQTKSISTGYNEILDNSNQVLSFQLDVGF
jgi:hypothetical protein